MEEGEESGLVQGGSVNSLLNQLELTEFSSKGRGDMVSSHLMRLYPIASPLRWLYIIGLKFSAHICSITPP